MNVVELGLIIVEIIVDIDDENRCQIVVVNICIVMIMLM